MLTPTDIQLIGNEVAIRWSDGVESYFTHEFLRAVSPSAENLGERDILGQQIGGSARAWWLGVGRRRARAALGRRMLGDQVRGQRFQTLLILQ